jgi:hypothetical protein
MPNSTLALPLLALWALWKSNDGSGKEVKIGVC